MTTTDETRELVVGDVVALRVHCLGNDIGTRGVVIDEYDLSGHSGVQVIFENGEYDGFSEEEQHQFLNFIAHDPVVRNYKFTNVIRLSEDYRKGKFNSSFISE